MTFGPDPSRQSCDEDALEVYDGDSPQAPLLARYCGTYRRASTIRSSGNTMYFVLRTGAGGPSFKRFTGEYSTSGKRSNGRVRLQCRVIIYCGSLRYGILDFWSKNDVRSTVISDCL